MMKILLILTVIYLCAANAQFMRLRPPGVPNDWRLIETGPNERVNLINNIKKENSEGIINS